MEYDAISSLEAIGYLEREATFLYLVAVHSGYFLRRQYNRFAGRDRGTVLDRLLRKADRRNHIQVIECGRGWHIYHLKSKTLYAALERPHSQNRRIKGDAHIKSRLMVLDFVLAHLSANMLVEEVNKVDFFTTQCGVRTELLPRSYAGRLMYFSDGFPILVSNVGVPRFTFFDEGQATTTRFERYLKQYQPLFAALGEFELIFVADSESNSARAKVTFNRFLPADRLRGVTPVTPLGVDHFLEFLAVRQQSEVGGRGVLSSDLKTLREGEVLYTSLEHQALYAAWKSGSTTVEKVRQRFLQTSMRVTFSTVVLPYRYPLEPARPEPLSDEDDDTHHHIHHDTHVKDDK
ncbi:hypothetical protein [Granulicella sp. L60]|uniref:hypothetical protein n=1 Tax=Granulicella sp. L60 TaxID=1641866 RepID=UPI00131B190C|nr:hypothetical protein [Granulicella sp. L60]